MAHGWHIHSHVNKTLKNTPNLQVVALKSIWKSVRNLVFYQNWIWNSHREMTHGWHFIPHKHYFLAFIPKNTYTDSGNFRVYNLFLLHQIFLIWRMDDNMTYFWYFTLAMAWRMDDIFDLLKKERFSRSNVSLYIWNGWYFAQQKSFFSIAPKKSPLPFSPKICAFLHFRRYISSLILHGFVKIWRMDDIFR